MSDHYFSAQPGIARKPRSRTVMLAGAERTVTTDSGIFSPDGVDKGTQVLLSTAPEPPARGKLLDIGCGWGPIALSLGLRAPEAEVYAVDVNERALEVTRENAAALGLSRVHVSTPQEIDPGLRFDLIWSNPPIRVGKAVLHEILQIWLPRLAVGGKAYLVVQKNLGSDSLQEWIAGTFDDLSIRRMTSVKAFRVLEVVRPAES
ncbi:class I SAM-dependent methyltransferase [Psychromicrobium xiongbiense]|uniref:class I SAM-dependent methyltransferase n=1 Tax=Psychromicrobium xiongbiense TaxID=3051184 RepID=UPI002554F161|nr:methyltransferase [Psychromicrobium sp. YIM S02556]